MPAKSVSEYWISEVKLNDAPLLRLAHRAIRYANVRFESLPAQSGLRRDDNDGRGIPVRDWGHRSVGNAWIFSEVEWSCPKV